MIEIAEERLTGDALGRWRQLWEAVYGRDTRAVAPFWEERLREWESLEGRSRAFFAIRAGEIVAALVAIAPGKTGGDEVFRGQIGYFEAFNDQAAVQTLFRAAVAYLEAKGAEEIIGPMNGDTWHEYRLSLGPYEHPPFLKEPYQKPYYQALWEAEGFEILQGYHSRYVEDLESLREFHYPRWAEAEKQGYRREPMSQKELPRLLERVYAMTTLIFEDAFLYEDIEKEAFLKLYGGVKTLLDERLSFILVGPEGDDAGFAFVFPDLIDALRVMKGEKTFSSKVRFLLQRRLHRPKRVNIKTVGVMPAHRGKGLSSAMAYLYLDSIIKAGFKGANMCLIADGNHSARADTGVGEVSRRYGLYIWKGGK